MSFQVDEKWLAEYQAKLKQGKSGQMQAAPALAPAQAQDQAKRSKYGNQKTESGGKRFDSKHEAKVYEQLRLRCLAGEFIALGCQVAFYLPGGIKYIADFVAMRPDGTSVVFDAKSEATRKDKVYRLKRRLMKACHNIDIQEV